MKYSTVTSILFSLLLPFYVSAAQITVYEDPKGVAFETLPANSTQIIFGLNFLEIDQWQNSYHSIFGELYKNLTQKPFISGKDRFLAVSKTANLVPLPVEKVIDKNLFFQPEYHQKLNPSFNLILVNANPLIFQTTQNIYGLIELSTKMHVELHMAEEINSTHGPYARAIRYTEEFNRALDHLITVSEFYRTVDNRTLVITYLTMGIKNNFMSTGIGSGIFRSKMKSYIKDSAVESLMNLNSLLGINQQ